MKRAIFVFPTNRSELVHEVRQGISPDNGLYGLNHLKEFFNTESVEVHGTWEKLLNILFLPVAVLFNSKHTKLNLGRVLLVLPGLNQVDLIVTCVDSVNKAACLLKKLGVLRCTLVCMAGNVLDGTESFLFLHRWLWSGADRIVTHAPVDQEKLIRLGLADRGSMIPVGADEEFWQKKARLPRQTLRRPRNDDIKLVVSVGADRDRDYRTLFLAATQLPGLKFLVCCGRKSVEGLKVPDNVEVKIDVSPLKTREILSKAEIVVLPLRETYRASGQLALIDEMLMGKPVIVSKTWGVVEAYGLENMKQAVLVPPLDVDALVQAIEKLQNNESLKRELGAVGRRLALGYTTRTYADKLKKIMLASS